MPATQPSPLYALDWLKEIVGVGPTKDWKQNMSATYRTFAAQGPTGIPMGLLKVVATAPSDFGDLIRDTAFRARLDKKKDTSSPTHEDHLPAGAQPHSYLLDCLARLRRWPLAC